MFAITIIMMSTADRKAKERGELKSLILQAAKKLFIEKGIEQTTIRNIADSIDYSVGTVYVYFKDKNDIFFDLHSQGFLQLGGSMRTLMAVQHPMERLKALGRVYIQFAMQNPEMYELMFSLKSPMDFLETTHKDKWNEGKATFDFLKQTVNDCIKTGYFKNYKLEALTYLIWGTVHGICSLKLSHRLKGLDVADPEKTVLLAYMEFLKMIENQ